MSFHIGKFKSTKQLTEENEQQGHLIEEKYEEGKGSQNKHSKKTDSEIVCTFNSLRHPPQVAI